MYICTYTYWYSMHSIHIQLLMRPTNVPGTAVENYINKYKASSKGTKVYDKFESLKTSEKIPIPGLEPGSLG